VNVIEFRRLVVDPVHVLQQLLGARIDVPDLQRPVIEDWPLAPGVIQGDGDGLLELEMRTRVRWHALRRN
jgi:hypothetical protein